MVKITISYFNYLKHISVVQPLWRPIWRFLKKLKIELPYNPEIPLLYIYLKKTKNNLKRYMHPNVHSSIFFYKSQDMETTEMPINR